MCIVEKDEGRFMTGANINGLVVPAGLPCRLEAVNPIVHPVRSYEDFMPSIHSPVH